MFDFTMYMSARARAFALLSTLAITGGVVFAEDANEPARRDDAAVVRAVSQRFAEQLGSWVNWDAAWSSLGTSVINAYERNGWTSEPDLYSLEVILDVGAIPPWKIEQRMDRFTELIADRYLLDDEQQAVARRLLEDELNHILREHATSIMPIALEGLQTWASGEPFTAEQLTRWTRATEPVFADTRARLDAAANTLMDSLDEEQRAWVRLDLSAAQRRVARVAEMRQAIARGEYVPADWGLRSSADAATPGGADSENPPTARPDTEMPTTRPTVDADPWAVYVREFIVRFKLNEAQQQQAWRTYRRVREQRDFHDARQTQRLERLRAAAQESPDRFNPRIAAAEAEQEAMRARLFEVLKRRLARLPTRSQRVAADE